MLPKEEISEKDEKFATISSISTHSNDFRVKEERRVDSSTLPLEESEQTSDKLNATDATLSIDVCPSNGNLLASSGEDNNIKIFDKRNSKIIRTFDDIHSGNLLHLFDLNVISSFEVSLTP